MAYSRRDFPSCLSYSLENDEFCWIYETTIREIKYIIFREIYIFTVEELHCTFTAIKTIANLSQYELSQEAPNLLKAPLYFSIQWDKIKKSEIFSACEKIHCSFLSTILNPRKLMSDKSASLVSFQFLFLELQSFSACTTSKSCLTKP